MMAFIIYSLTGGLTMKRIAALVLLSVPLCTFAQNSEIDQLRQELDELKQLNALYVSKIEAME